MKKVLLKEVLLKEVLLKKVLLKKVLLKKVLLRSVLMLVKVMNKLNKSTNLPKCTVATAVPTCGGQGHFARDLLEKKKEKC